MINKTLLQHGETIAVALSGGKDSICLLSLLLKAQKEFNLTFKQLCLNHQMVAAKKLITKSDLSLNQVAINIGFDSYKGFALAFKKYYGFAPTKFRS